MSSAGSARVVISARKWFDLNLREVWASRELVYFFIWRDVKIRYKQTLLGAGWAILHPFFMMIVFSIIFGRFARLSSDGLPYPIFYYSALVPWIYFSNALILATNRVVDQQRVITKVYFPRLILPVSAVLSGLVDFAFGFAMFVGMMLFYGFTPGWRIFALPLFLLLAILTALSLGVWLSALNAIYRDVRFAVPIMVQLWMFLSPVVYPTSLVPARWQWLYALNPMAVVIDGFRWTLTGHGGLPGTAVFAPVGFVAMLLVGGVVYFRKMEGKITDVV